MTINIEQDEDGFYYWEQTENGIEGNYYNRDIWPQHVLKFWKKKKKVNWHIVIITLILFINTLVDWKQSENINNIVSVLDEIIEWIYWQ